MIKQPLIWEQMRERANLQLETLFQSLNMPSERLRAAMEYAVLSHGKRLRPILVYLSGITLGVSLEKLDSAVCAVECMHAYSLIHDDLPAMDDDDWRRGKPTCHRAFDEASAILAGDALQALAFQQILMTNSQKLTMEQKNEMAILLSLACGAQGMVSGQALDLEYLNKKDITIDLLQKIHQLKTGVFIETCINLVMAVSIDLSPEKKQALSSFAQCLGLAFQIQDDYLDLYGETDKLGKQQGADKKQGKMTYVNFYAEKDLINLIEELYEKALNDLKIFGGSANALVEFTQYLAQRKS